MLASALGVITAAVVVTATVDGPVLMTCYVFVMNLNEICSECKFLENCMAPIN